MHQLCIVYVIALIKVYALAATSDGCQQFQDVASRTVVADVVFQGRMASLPVHINQSDNSHVIEYDRNFGASIQVNFSVERILKGQLSASHITVGYSLNDAHRQCRQLGVSRDITEETTDTDDVDELSIGGVDAVVGMKYIVFINTSQLTSDAAANNSVPTSSTTRVHWAMGSPEIHNTKVQKTVMALACQHCGTSDYIVIQR
jgi:hypothetical protein